MRFRFCALLPFVVLSLAPLVLAAQDEGALRRHFEGRMVTVRLDMPGTEDGVDVNPGTSRPLDYPKYATRIKDYGVAIRNGTSVMVTKLKVKDKLIEFQLGGGGFGTFGDDDSPTVSVSAVARTRRERDLEKAVKTEQDRDRKRDMERELDDLRQAREREDRRNEAIAATATEQKREHVRQRRLEGGSRFNLRYRNGVPASALTPEAIMQALEQYVEFPGDRFAASAASPGSPADGPAPAIRLGMLLGEVDSLLGPPVATEERMEGRYRVSVRSYDRGERRITAEFVEGVAVRIVNSLR
ncbi:MAG: hypothetical protein ABI742_04010 [Gemmatimonadota bacterium]